MTLIEHISREVKAALEDQNIKAEAAARMAGVGTEQVYRILRGEGVRLVTLEAVMEALGLQVIIKPKEAKK